MSELLRREYRPVVCTTCGFHCWVEKREEKIYAKHPEHPCCRNSEKVWEIAIEQRPEPVVVIQEVDKDFLNDAEGKAPC